MYVSILPETKSLAENLLVQCLAAIAAETEIVNLRRLVWEGREKTLDTDHMVIAFGYR